eukprot:g29894.t1
MPLTGQVLLRVNSFDLARPVFQSDAEVEAAYRDAFGPATAPGQETDYESAEESDGPYVPTVRCTEALEKPVPSPESLELLAVYKRSGMMP